MPRFQLQWVPGPGKHAHTHKYHTSHDDDADDDSHPGVGGNLKCFPPGYQSGIGLLLLLTTSLSLLSRDRHHVHVHISSRQYERHGHQGYNTYCLSAVSFADS